MPSGCCVPNCTSTIESHHLFGFPTDVELIEQWEKNIPRRNWKSSKWSKICHIHFEAEYIITPDDIDIEVQKAYEEALLHEEERIAHQRKLLLLYRKQIRERELQILDETQNCVLRKTLTSKESELDNLLKTLERNKIREETDIMIAEENFKDRETSNLEDKLLRENRFYEDGTPYGLRFKNTVRSVEIQRQKLFAQIEKIKNDAIQDIKNFPLSE